MRTFQSRAGFTLIELLVVVVIIGILAGVGVQGYAAAQDRARNSSMITNVRTTFIGVENWRSDHGGAVVPTELYGEDANTAVSFGTVGGSPDTNTPSSSWPRYLPGGRVPTSPWANTPQSNVPGEYSNATLIGPDGSGAAAGLWFKGIVSSDDTLNVLPDGSFGDGPNANDPGETPPRNQGPSKRTHYGFIYYVGSSDSGRYAVLGVGKQGKNTKCISVRTNFQ